MEVQQGKHSAPRRAKRRRGTAARRRKILRLVLTDLLFIGLGLIVFALFHHVIRFPSAAEPVTLPAAVTAAPEPAETPAVEAPVEETPAVEETPEPTPARIYSGVWGEKFAEHFTEGEILTDGNSYRSENISIEVRTVKEDGICYHVADIYVSDIKYLRAGLGNGQYWAGTQFTDEQARANDALVAVSGDHYSGRWEGVVVRNGVLYRETRFADVCVLGYDGVMRTMTDEEFDLDAVTEQGAWQVWSFGPMLLQDGKAMTKFNSELTRANPRSAIGYFEPGHYCFVQVDGRDRNESRGMTLEELSQLFASLGCTAAYNLDGGQSSGFAWKGELLSYPYGRKVSDIIYVGELPEEAAESEGEG